jgi:hypothetical protein
MYERQHVSCSLARDILGGYFQRIRQTGLRNGAVMLTDDNDDIVAYFICQGSMYGGGRCRAYRQRNSRSSGSEGSVSSEVAALACVRSRSASTSSALSSYTAAAAT